MLVEVDQEIVWVSVNNSWNNSIYDIGQEGCHGENHESDCIDYQVEHIFLFGFLKKHILNAMSVAYSYLVIWITFVFVQFNMDDSVADDSEKTKNGEWHVLFNRNIY